jgi:hypothetical protein
MQKILLIGGSGKQSSSIYLPILVDSNRKDINLIAIADPIDPFKSKFTDKFATQLKVSGTRWIALKNNLDEDIVILDEFLKNMECDTIIISCPPIYHSKYVDLGLRNGLDVIVDKPVVCLPNQFGKFNAAEDLRKDYLEMVKTRNSSVHKKFKRPCMVYVPLMRRVTEPYTQITDQLSEVYRITNQSLTNMLACRSDGCYRFADEFDRPGAHGYREGLGTLTMSGYHYLDFIAACVMAAPVKGNLLESTMINKTTVGEIRRTSQAVPFGQFLNNSSKKEDNDFVGDNAELDFSVSINIKDSHNKVPNCELLFTFIQRGCTRRVTPNYSLDTTHDEGLTNDCSFIIHQGPFQSFHTLVVQDPSNDGRISVVRRLNPLLAEKMQLPTISIQDYALKNNENTLNNRKIIDNLLDKFTGSNQINIYDKLDINYQKLTVDLYAAVIGASVNLYSVPFELDK